MLLCAVEMIETNNQVVSTATADFGISIQTVFELVA